MNDVTKRRLVGAAVLAGLGILVPVLLVWWVQPGGPLEGESVRVYEIDDSGEAVPVGEAQKSEGASAPDKKERPRATAPERDSAPAETREGPRSPAPQPETEPEVAIPDEPEPEPAKPSKQTKAKSSPEPAPDETSQPAPSPSPKPEPGTAEAASSGPAAEGGWVVQIGSFGKAENARAMKAKVEDDYPVFITESEVGDVRYHRVRVGPYDAEAEAEAAAKRLSAAGHNPQVQSLETAE